MGSQALWLQQGFELEFMGRSTSVPGLWLAGVGFFMVNCWLLGVVVGDIGRLGREKEDLLDGAVLGQKSVRGEKTVTDSQSAIEVKHVKRKS